MYEFEFDGFTKEQCDAYLKRINASFDGELTLDNLEYLIRQHQKNVPFEDLAVHDHWGTVKLDPDSLFKKIVTDHRGGFCFELNGAFLLLLKGLGYDVAGCMCRIGNPAFGVLRRLDHRGVIATVDGKQYYCDVGMGGIKPKWPVSFSGEKRGEEGKSYWIEDTDKGWKMLKNDTKDNNGACVIIAPIAMLPFDFYGNCDDMLNRGDTIFHTTRKVNIDTENGYVEIADNIIKVVDGDNVTSWEYDDSELPELLKKYYGIDYK